tara:strand:+ start:534 stop:1202 length:669 start_codon:yes stop_codon:yes gene_type:complete
LAEEYVISVVLEGNSSGMTNATNKASKSQQNLKTSTDSANIALLANIAMFQATVAALNQVSGGLNKFAGALDKVGAKDTAKVVRNIATAFELVAGPLEVVLAGFTFYIVLSSAAASGAIGFSLANFTLAGSLTAAATAMAGFLITFGPFLLLAGVVILLAKHFNVLGRTIDVVMNPLQSLKNLLEGIADVINFIDGGFRRMSDTFSGAFTSLSPTSILKGGA